MSVLRIYSKALSNIIPIIFISLIAASALLFYGFSLGYDDYRGGYAVLTVDASIEDRDIYDILTSDTEFALNSVSESTQWVVLDNFGSLEKVPLDKYSSRIFSFDPRNDGYAAKLKDVFIKDGKRYIYIPLSSGIWNASALDKQFISLMDDIPFSIEYYGIEKPVWIYFSAYGASSLAILIIILIKRKTFVTVSGNFAADACIIPILPVLSALVFYGTAGIAVAALFFGFFFLLKELLKEIAMMQDTGFSLKLKEIFKETEKSNRMDFFFFPLFILTIGIVAFVNRFDLLFLLTVFIASFAVLLLSSGTIQAFFLRRRRRFNPVLIIKRRVADFSFSVYIIPFCAAVFFVFFITPQISGGYNIDKKFNTIVEEQDYHSHLIYQATFSTRQLGTSLSSFPAYTFDEDGLPYVKNITEINPDQIIAEFPSFPLKDLMDFFIDVNTGRINNETAGNSNTEKLSLLILLLFILPVFFTRKKSKNNEEFSYVKKLSANQRSRAINRNKVFKRGIIDKSERLQTAGSAATEHWALRFRKDA